MRHSGLTLLFLLVLVGATAIASEPPITAVAFAPDGESVIAASQSGLHIYDWPELKRQRTIECSAANLHCLAFSPATELLAVGGGDPSENGSVEIFSWPAAERVTTLAGHEDSVRAVVWQSSTRLMSASFDREISLWDIGRPTLTESLTRHERSRVRTFKGHSRSVSSLCLLKDGTILVSSGDDQAVRVWDVVSGGLIRSLNQHTGFVHNLAVRPSSDGLPMVASAAADRTIRFWQPTIGRMVRYIRIDAEPLDLAWLNDGTQLVAACVDGQIRVVHADEVKVTQTLPVFKGRAYAIAVHPSNGSVVVAGTNGQIRRIELRLH
jgi:WD40 repeat protein